MTRRDDQIEQRQDPPLCAPAAVALTADEMAVLKLTASLWNVLVRLPDPHPSDAREYSLAVHAIQEKVMARLARRVHPEFFR